MVTLPQLIEEDIRQLDGVLREFLKRTESASALIIDKGGFLIAHKDGAGAEQFDHTTIAALASGSFMANQTIAGLVNETHFDSVYQQGENFSMFIINVDEHCLLVVIFPVQTGVGAVKYFAAPARESIAAQIQKAHDRDPGAGLDLSVLNVAETADFFRKR
jgi:predicted regulator of Ras-like GTPase activity (Roadblock/LC7/MglB family)